MQDNSYERHRLSQLSNLPGSDTQYVFEARGVPGVERDSAEAESMRLQWLGEWLSVRNTCRSGYQVLERRLFETGEFNSRDSEFRYLLRCRATVSESDGSLP